MIKSIISLKKSIIKIIKNYKYRNFIENKFEVGNFAIKVLFSNIDQSLKNKIRTKTNKFLYTKEYQGKKLILHKIWYILTKYIATYRQNYSEQKIFEKLKIKNWKIEKLKIKFRKKLTSPVDSTGNLLYLIYNNPIFDKFLKKPKNSIHPKD